MKWLELLRELPAESAAKLLRCPREFPLKTPVVCGRGSPEHVSCDACIAAWLQTEADPADYVITAEEADET